VKGFSTLLKLTVMAALATAAIFVTGALADTHPLVTPTQVDNNITEPPGGNNDSCATYMAAGTFTGVQVGPGNDVAAGAHTVVTGNTPNNSPFTLTIDVSQSNQVSFSITGGIVQIAAVKGGPGGYNLYDYRPIGGATADSGLVDTNSGTVSHLVFCIGNGTALAVQTSSFKATRHGKAVTLRWRTASEVGTIGFNVYRQSKGMRVKVNRSLIQAVSLNGSSSSGRYVYRAKMASSKLAASSSYWLQEVHQNGSRSWYGPARAYRAT
jgi:hypothetical protein